MSDENMKSLCKNNETWVPESVFTMLTFDLISRLCSTSLRWLERVAD